MKGSLKSVY